MSLRTIEWRDGVVVTIDQTKLPTQEVYVELKTCEDIAYAIKEMKVRGAPLIGVAAAMGLALTAFRSKARSRQDLMKELEASAKLLRETRPT
ncbi:MAG TPA: S-methyl-5-thioribose-1-phosphate isomerase, partial [Candidatus Bathyarchaeota archaeon]|nr:S-methyl-5-thioribose-1-phosphate isomerase [Candidatus Bathyarchaeota archaeon]